MAERKAIWAQVTPMPADQLVPFVRSLDSARVEGIWAPQLFGAPFATLTAAAAVTTRLKLGTGIALAFVRSPLETACSAIDLDMISQGRAVLGLGSSAASQIEGSFGSIYGKPLAHMREIVAMVRAIIAHGHDGTLGLLEGEYHRLDLSHFRLLAPAPREAIPIYLPAIYEKACNQAGAIADGLLGHPLWNTSWIRDQVHRNLADGLAKARRQRSDFSLNLSIFTIICSDRREGIEDARATVAYYSQNPQYLRYFEAIGFGREARAIQSAFARGATAEMVAACSDDMVESIAVIGNEDEVQAAIAARAEGADAITPVVPHYGLGPEKALAYSERIAALFYG